MMTFRRCYLEFGWDCAKRSFGSKEFLQFWPTFRVGHFLPNNPIVIDIGANVGDFAHACLLRWEKPEIVCCEPIPEIYAILKKRFTTLPNIKCLNVAIYRDSGFATFKQSSDTGFSSFLSMNYDYLDFGLGCEIVKEILVECKTLSELVNNHLRKSIDLIKVDVQGTELDVLSTLGGLNYPVQTVQIEMSLFEVYKNQPLMQSVIEFMNQAGYDLVDVYSPIKNKRGIVIQVEGIFLRRISG